MAKLKKDSQKPPKKNLLWVPYRLQSLGTTRFISVTNRILAGEFHIVKLPEVTEIQ